MIAVLLVLTVPYSRVGVLDKLETVSDDTIMRMKRAPSDSPVAIVAITDTDFRDSHLFNGERPLNRNVLAALIQSIDRGGASVIGVDVDTSDHQYAELQVPRLQSRVVWECELRHVPPGVSHVEELRQLPVLGGTQNLNPAVNSVGVPLMIDVGGVTRYYTRVVQSPSGDLASFPWAIVQAYGRATANDKLGRQRRVHYSSSAHRLMLAASNVLEHSHEWPQASPFRGSVVLLGGTYLDEDRHDTPLGTMTGVEVMANVVETELERGGGEIRPNRTLVLVLEFFEAVVLVLLFHGRNAWSAAYRGVALIIVLAPLCSYIACGSSSEIIRFGTVLLGLLAFELYDHYRRGALPRAYERLIKQA